MPFEHSRGMQILRSLTDLSPKKTGMKQIFPDTARQPRPPAHIKEQTDERISQTIVRIQTNQAKRVFSRIFRSPSWPLRRPGPREVLLGRKSKPSLQATCCHRGGASAQRAAPGRAEFLELALRRAPVRPKFCHFIICESCKFCAHEPTLSYNNSVPNNFSKTPRANQNHQHISKNKLTGGYRKRLSGFRAGSQNVTKMPENSVHHFLAPRTHRREYFLDGGT